MNKAEPSLLVYLLSMGGSDRLFKSAVRSGSAADPCAVPHVPDAAEDPSDGLQTSRIGDTGSQFDLANQVPKFTIFCSY